MRIYFERYIICDGCKDSKRQTASKIDFDWIGKLLHNMLISEFKESHEECKSTISFTKWRKGHMSD